MTAGGLPTSGDRTEAPGRTPSPERAEAGAGDAGLRALLVVGTGLIGTSVALAARAAGLRVLLHDGDPGALRAAAARGAGEALPSLEHAATAVPPAEQEGLVALACVSPPAAAPVMADLLRLLPAATVSDVTSVKARPLLDLEAYGADTTRVVGGHPMAGAATRGPAGAAAALLLGRSWAVCPSPVARPRSVALVLQLVEACGAVPVVVDPVEHDRAVAVLSHLPQLLASALAAQAGALGDTPLRLAGPAFRDLTRVADSSPDLWRDIAAGNAEVLLAALRRLLDRLERVQGEGSRGGDLGDAVAGLVAEGGRARERFVDKPGRAPVPVAEVLVHLADRPGALAGALAALAAAEVNVEDLRLEHDGAQPGGLARLLLPRDRVTAAVDALSSAGLPAVRAR